MANRGKPLLFDRGFTGLLEILQGPAVVINASDVIGLTPWIESVISGSTIYDLSNAVEDITDIIGVNVLGTNGVIATFDDLGGETTLSLDVEYTQDMISTFIVAGSGITVTYDDVGNTLTLGTDLKTINGTSIIGSGDISISASPSGSTGQIQYNNAGAFAGATNVLVDNSDLVLEVNSSPITPTTGVKLFGRSVGGRNMAAIVGPSGLDTVLQPHIAKNKVASWIPSGNGTGVTLVGAAALAATGTVSGVNVSTTNLYTMQRRIEYLVLVAATTAVAGFRFGQLQYSVGGTGAGLGGFHFITRWAPATGVATSTHRCFVGMVNQSSHPITDVEPSTITNMVGVGWDAADTNIQIMHRGYGALTKIDLGASFPKPNVDRSKCYELVLFSPTGTTQLVYYEFTELGTSNKATGTISTRLPQAAVLLAPRGWMSVGGTSSEIGISLVSLYIETDY